MRKKSCFYNKAILSHFYFRRITPKDDAVHTVQSSEFTSDPQGRACKSLCALSAVTPKGQTGPGFSQGPQSLTEARKPS